MITIAENNARERGTALETYYEQIKTKSYSRNTHRQQEKWATFT
jgi:hypothetical protein